jgi:hypothetical protein
MTTIEARNCASLQTHLTTTFAAMLRRKLIAGLLGGVLLALCAGCQTFSLTEEQFQRQQRGEMADPKTGAAVQAVGTVGYLGAIISEAVAVAGRK